MKLFNADAIVRSKDAGPFRFTLDVISMIGINLRQ